MMHKPLAYGIQRNILFHTTTNAIVLHISKAMPSCPVGAVSKTVICVVYENMMKGVFFVMDKYSQLGTKRARIITMTSYWAR